MCVVRIQKADLIAKEQSTNVRCCVIDYDDNRQIALTREIDA